MKVNPLPTPYMTADRENRCRMCDTTNIACRRQDDGTLVMCDNPHCGAVYTRFRQRT